MDKIQEQIAAQREIARDVCATEGINSADCAVAWDVVEEMQAEVSHKRPQNAAKNNLELFCEKHPESQECLIYDN